MPITKKKKNEIIRDLAENFKNAPSLVFVNFHGLTVKDTDELRKKLRKSGARLRVARKTLVKKAFGEAGITGDMPDLPGEIAVLSGEDPITPAQEVFLFGKAHEGRPSIEGGVLEAHFIGKDDALRLATLPGREVLYGKFLSVLSGPGRNFVGVLSNTVSAFPRVLSAIAKVK